MNTVDYANFVEHLPSAAAMLDRDLRYLLVSRTWCQLFGLVAQDLTGQPLSRWLPQLSDALVASTQQCLATAQTTIVEAALDHNIGTLKWLKCTMQPWYDQNALVGGLILICEAVSDRQRTERLLTGQNQILELVAKGSPLPVVLEAVTQLIEAQGQQVYCSFLLLDETGRRLRHGAAPSLPEAYNQAIDGLEIGAKVGSCGTAAFLKQTVIVEDIFEDPLWEDYRDFALSHGLRACWSTPILSKDNQVLATFAMYHPFPYRPTPVDRELVDRAAYLARIAIEYHQAEVTLKRSAEQLEEQIECRTRELQSAIASLTTTNNQLQREIYDRQQAEERLQQKNGELQAIFQALPDLYFRLDLEGTIQDYQANIDSNLYVLPETFLGRRITDLLPSETSQIIARAIQQANQTRSLVTVEYDLLIAEQEQTFEARFLPLANDQLIAIVRNISDRIQAEAALRQSEYRLRTVISSAPIVLFALDRQGRFTLSEGKALESIGLEAGQVVGQSAYELYHDRPDILSTLDYALGGEEFTVFVEVADIVFETRYRPLWDDAGELTGTIGIAVDVTERHHIEEMLRQQANREYLLNQLTNQIRNSLNLQTILNTTVREVRKLLQIDRCNFAWYYRDPEDPYWRIVSEACNDDLPDLRGRYSAKVMGQFSEKLLAQQTLWIDDVSQIPDDKFRQYVESIGYRSVLIIPFQSQSGVIGTLACCHCQTIRPWEPEEIDLLQAVMSQLVLALNQAELYRQSRAKTKELETALFDLQRTQAQLIQSEKMSSLGQLVAGVAHEINNPVNFIYGNLAHADEYTQDLLKLVNLYQKHYPNPDPEISDQAEMVDLDFLVEDLPRLLSSMRVGTERIQKIVASLRTFSHMNESEFKAVDLHEGIDSTLLILKNRIKATTDRPEIHITKQYGDLPLVECYAGQLNQVFMNLLSNALDALEESFQAFKFIALEEGATCTLPMIVIQTQLVNQSAVIRIADNGPGIPTALQSKLFDLFFTTKPVGKGTGMGLSISYQIITEKHNGKLSCQSSPGQGAEFIIELPICQTSKESA